MLRDLRMFLDVKAIVQKKNKRIKLYEPKFTRYEGGGGDISICRYGVKTRNQSLESTDDGIL